MDGEAWWAAIYGVTQSWIRLKRLSSSSRDLLKNLLDFTDDKATSLDVVWFIC